MMRVVRPDDAPRIAEIYRYYVESTAITFEERAPTAEEMSAKIQKVRESFPWIVLEEGSRLLGYAYASRYRERAAYRWSVEDSVYLDPEARGQGRGAALLSTLIAILRLQGFAKVYAVITPPNPASVAVHRKLGFAPLCRFGDTAFKLGVWQSIDWMELTLLPPAAFVPGSVPAEPIPFSALMTDRAAQLASLLGS